MNHTFNHVRGGCAAYLRTILYGFAILVADRTFGEQTTVLVIKDGSQKVIHRFTVENPGAANETWTETTPLLSFSGNKSVNAVIPAHGYY